MWPFKKTTVKKAKRVFIRTFDAASRLPFLSGPVGDAFDLTGSINADIRAQGDQLRASARQMSQNEPMAVKYLNLVGANVVGASGIQLYSQVVTDRGEPDEDARKAIEAAWAEWGKICDVSGRMTWDMMCRAMVKGKSRDGEFLIIEHKNTFAKFGYQLQFLDPIRIATELNQDANEATNQNAIIMGVEVNNFGRPIAYHLHLKYTTTAGLMVPSRRDKPERIPADRVIHGFTTEFPEQVRGFSKMHASMLRMHNLKKYQEAAGVAAAAGTAKMGIALTEGGDESLEALADSKDENGTLITEAIPGSVWTAPDGVVDFKSYDPTYPHEMYSDFVKTSKRDISTGLNVSYHGLSNDLEGVNFSSIRSGTLEEREQWKVEQEEFIEEFCDRVFNTWVRLALLKGAILSKNGNALPSAKTERFSAHKFRGRRWPWVDPLKDEQANERALANKTDSPYNIAAQKGNDLDEVLDDFKRFQDAIERKGINMALFGGVVNTPQAEPSTPDKEDNNDADEQQAA